MLAADYGVPQLRKRAFFIGNNLGIDPEFLFPPKINKDYITVEDAIFDLPFIKSGQGEFETITEYIDAWDEVKTGMELLLKKVEI